MNSPHMIATGSTILCCHTCASKLIDGKAGASDPLVTEISFGTRCECHPSALSAMATHPITLTREDWRDALGAPWQPRVVGDEPTEEPPPPPWADVARPLGPKTKIACDLLCAWTREEKHADPALIEQSVLAAEFLLRLTKGQ